MVPCFCFLLQCCHIRYSPIKTLFSEHAEFYFRNVQPTAVLGRIMYLKTFGKTPSLFGLKRLIK